MPTEDFDGCKLALLQGDKLIVYQRDKKNDIVYPGKIYFPGGGREGNEAPGECVLRELKEEFGLTICMARLTYCEKYIIEPSMKTGYFFAATISASEVRQVSFGSDGIYWQLMTCQKYLRHPEGVPHLKERLRVYLERDL